MKTILNFETSAARFLRAVLLISLIFTVFYGCSKHYVKPTPEQLPSAEPTVHVALNDNLQQADFQFLETYTFISEEATYELDKSLGEFTVLVENNKITFKSPKRFFSFSEVKQIKFNPLNKNGFRWNGNTYHGRLIFLKNGNTWLAINEVPMSVYLKGVVPYEIPSKSADYYQAVLAQTIAARSYANYHLKHPASRDFDVYADTRDQVYSGFSKKSENAEKAVDETFGLILVDSVDAIVETQYHSTCGGIIEPRNEYFRGSPIQQEYRDFSDSTFNCTVSPLYRWTEIVEANDILLNLLKIKFITQSEYDRYSEDGFTLNLAVENRLSSGRVNRMSVNINNKKILLNEWDIRRVLTSRKRKTLPSTLFFLKQSKNSASKFYLIGAGFGHGRGLCQWGAIGQSLKGKDYREILKLYYPQLKLKKIY